MKKRSRLLFLLALCAALSFTGCRHRGAETESETETQSETVSEAKTEKTTSSETETEKSKTTVKRTSVLPSTVTGNTGDGSNKQTDKTQSTNKTTTSTNKTTTGTATTATQQCPYCYQQISTAPDGNGSTIYETHVAQEKAWAELNGYDPNTTPTTEANQATSETDQAAPSTDAGDTAQCGYCYQWFTVSDGSYAAHIAEENAALGMPEGTEYITCPICGYAFPKGSMYDNHVHVTE